ncbi:MAG TPA: transcription termination/antitermination protein NusG [Candidatus Krumholzibacteriaceae bacterium]|nr:transcription termination/antitermination protein NusG [Candidatus Krumholzibacteriaceae bacterium]
MGEEISKNKTEEEIADKENKNSVSDQENHPEEKGAEVSSDNAASDGSEEGGEGKDGQNIKKTEDDDQYKNMKWYVVHTYSGREKKVRDSIERIAKNSGLDDKFGNILVATEEVAEMKKGKKKVRERKLFPSYIVIQMEMSNETWNLVENVTGVTHFVGGREKPLPIPKKDVDRILGRMEKREGIIPEVPFTLGEHVNVVDGPFSEFTGIVDEISPERGKLKVLVSIFGRETPVELDFLQVKPL